MRTPFLPAAAALTLLAAPAAAQANDTLTTSTILRVPGKTIEILGLRRWTPAMIQDSMNVYSPGDSLTSHACAAVLRYRLKFAEAGAFGERAVEDSSAYLLVPVIEPQDSALVTHRPLPYRDTANAQAPWTPLLELTRGPDEDLMFEAVQARIAARAEGRAPAVPARYAKDSLRVHEVWDYLDRHNTPADFEEATKLLAGAPNVRDRTVAVAILASFEQKDAAWHTLAATLREQEGSPRMYAGVVLGAWARATKRQVDWRPAAEDLHAVLNGSNLWMLDHLMETLTLTGVDPALAKPLLQGGGHAVLMFAGAAHPRFREPAHRFLVAVSGRDYGRDVAAWRAWIAGL